MRTVDERLDEVGLVSDRVRAAEHRVLGLRHELRERCLPEKRADVGEDRVGALAEHQQRDAGRIVDVLVQNRGELSVLECLREHGRVGCSSEREQLHEQPPIGGDQLAVSTAPLLTDVGVVGARVGCTVSDARCVRGSRAAHVAALGSRPFE